MLYNINPQLWGNSCWDFMHYLTIAYPDEPNDDDKLKIKNFFLSIKDVLPCEKCRIHFAINLQNTPLNDYVLSSRYNLINWLRNIHNEVNTRQNKKIFSYDEVIKKYSNKYNNYNVEILTFILIILLIIIIIIYYKIKKNN